LKIKKKDWEQLIRERDYLRKIANTRLVIEFGNGLPEPEIQPIFDATLEHTCLIRKFGGYADDIIRLESNGDQWFTGATRWRIIPPEESGLDTPLSGYERFLFSHYMSRHPQAVKCNPDSGPCGQLGCLECDSPFKVVEQITLKDTKD
jgi:hypothetical protein